MVRTEIKHVKSWGPENQGKRDIYTPCPEEGTWISECLRFDDDGKRRNVLLLGHRSEDTRKYQQRLLT